jgi:hypothetical protein
MSDAKDNVNENETAALAAEGPSGEVTKLMGELGELKKQVLKLKEEKEVLEKQLGELSTQSKAKDQELGNLRDDFVAKEKEVKEKESVIEAKTAEIIKLTEQKEKEVLELKSQLEANVEKTKELSKDFEKKLAENTQKAKEAQESEATALKTQNEYAMEQQKRSLLLEHQSAVGVLLAEHKETIAGKDQQIREGEEKYKAECAAKGELAAKMGQMEADNQEAVAKLKQEMGTKDEAIAKLSGQMQGMLDVLNGQSSFFHQSVPQVLELTDKMKGLLVDSQEIVARETANRLEEAMQFNRFAQELLSIENERRQSQIAVDAKQGELWNMMNEEQARGRQIEAHKRIREREESALLEAKTWKVNALKKEFKNAEEAWKDLKFQKHGGSISSKSGKPSPMAESELACRQSDLRNVKMRLALAEKELRSIAEESERRSVQEQEERNFRIQQIRNAQSSLDAAQVAIVALPVRSTLTVHTPFQEFYICCPI